MSAATTGPNDWELQECVTNSGNEDSDNNSDFDIINIDNNIPVASVEVGATNEENATEPANVRSNVVDKDYVDYGSYTDSDSSSETIYYATSSSCISSGSDSETETDSPEVSKERVDSFSIVCENTVRKILSTTKTGFTMIQIMMKFQKYMIPIDMKLYDRVKYILRHMDMCVSEKVNKKILYSIRRCKQCKAVFSTFSQIHKDWKNVCVQCIEKKNNKYKCFKCKKNKNNNKNPCKQCEENKQHKNQSDSD